MRRFEEPDGTSQIGRVAQQPANASIIELHGAFEDQAREDLMLRVLFGAIGVRIGRQGVGSDLERRDENGTRGFAGDAHE